MSWMTVGIIATFAVGFAAYSSWAFRICARTVKSISVRAIAAGNRLSNTAIAAIACQTFVQKMASRRQGMQDLQGMSEQ